MQLMQCLGGKSLALNVNIKMKFQSNNSKFIPQEIKKSKLSTKEAEQINKDQNRKNKIEHEK